MRDYTYLFGPVPSRRFGRSLGVDLVPFKTCSFDCVFCQLGCTTHKTLSRKEYVPVKNVVNELGEWIKTDGDADYITLSGSGEPTLHSQFGDVIEFARKETSIPVVLLTNGSMLYCPEVRSAASGANIVKVSLSAWNQSSFEHINRPDSGLAFDDIFKGLRTFRDEFEGQIWLEVFMVWGVNSVPDDVRKIAELASKVNPDKIQLNTAIRPAAQEFVQALPYQEMDKLKVLFNPSAEVIAEFSGVYTPKLQVNKQTILAMLQRRPCTREDIANSSGIHLNEVLKHLLNLEQAGHVRFEYVDGTAYYRGVQRENYEHANV